MKKFDKTECVIWALALLPLVMTAAVYTRLPAQIPIHWNLEGEIDGYSAKAAAWMMPSISLLVSGLLSALPRIDPRRENYAKFGGAYRALRLVLALFFLLMCAVTLYAAFEPTKLPMERVVTAGVGVLFCVMGNYMPKFRHNYFCGIRTPWTLASEEVWSRTHRLAGPIWFVGGLLIAAGSVLFVPPAVLFVLVLGAAVLCGLIPCVYSYILYKRTQKPAE